MLSELPWGIATCAVFSDHVLTVPGVGWYIGRMSAGKFVVEIEREDDGRWIAEVVALPGVMA
jgi:hypothetical protein